MSINSTRKNKSKNRKLTYSQAVSEALVQNLRRDKSIFIMGLGVTDYKGIFTTTIEANRLFGPGRVIETPASENALTGISIGAALMGKRPVLTHARNDFMFLALDQMLNGAAKWKYTYNGKSSVPFVARGLIGRGWGQGPTHSQSIQSVFMHFPGLHIAMPSTPYDVKGILDTALTGDTPFVILEHRALYNNIGKVPKSMYRIPLGKGRVVCEGRDITLAATSLMVQEGVKAHIALKEMGIGLEVIDPRFLCPLDERLIIGSVKKTGRLICGDTSWTTCGFASEVSAMVSEKAFRYLKTPVKRIGLAPSPAPVSKALEEAYYPTYKDIFIEACRLAGRKPKRRLIDDPLIDDFKGPY